MAKGKNFNAAEKHFEEKCVEWRKKIRELELTIRERDKRIVELQSLEATNKKLIEDIQNLTEQNQILLELKEMSKEDIHELVKAKRTMNNWTELANPMSRWM